ncbi:hypothetical protein QTI33_08425 [Variovorax sp. J22P271]|uniref:hypothetical protein n=1 Tax=Variovorax davisae TaxID=3053515 RepID=UPI00257504DA|nr:hypothetical protein [Variovorax sp. J22P271]MDM0032160.1 hypothetical protein [Variovorax sp. J22P271]
MTKTKPAAAAPHHDSPALHGEAPPKGKSNRAAGETRWAQASADGLQREVPQQPNELDESASSQEASNASMDVIGQLAHHDAVAGVDTDRGPVMDAVYNGPVTEGHRVGDEEKVHGERDPTKSTSSPTP